MTQETLPEIQLSIVIPVYNGASTLGPLLAALKEVQQRSRIEYIFVDDASTDNTVARLCAAGHTPLQHRARGGPARARNSGAARARGRWILFLDADTAPPAHLLARIEAIDQDRSVIALVGVYAKTPLNPGFWPRYKALQAWSYHALTSVQEINWIWGAMSAVRRSAFTAVGGFNEGYQGADLEDVELGRRLSRHGRILLDRHFIVGHHFPDSAWQNIRNHFHRGRLWCHLHALDRRFDSYLTTQAQALARVAIALCPLAAVLAIVLSGIGSIIAASFAVALLLAYEQCTGGFFRFCMRTAGPIFALRAAAAESLLAWVLILAALVVVAERSVKQPTHSRIVN
jgi:GT2 family glycosyltransferase